MDILEKDLGNQETTPMDKKPVNKKLILGLAIGGGALLIAAIVLIIVLALAGGCSEHVDADKDGKCDNCSAEVEINCNGEHTDADGDSVCDICEEYFVTAPVETLVNVTYTLVDQDGAPIPGVKVSFFKGSATTPAYTGTSSADGKLTVEMMTGAYSIDYVYDGFYQALTRTVTVIESNTNVQLLFNNTTPNGTTSRPYPLTAGESNEYTLAVGEQSYFIVYRAINLLVDITGENIKVTYGETIYESDENGKINFELVGEDTNSTALLLIENTGAAAAGVAVSINSRPGTQGNPIVIESLDAPVTAAALTKESMVYYRYIATETGALTLTATGAGAYASMQNARNSIVVSTNEADGNVITLNVEAGDEILINISMLLDGVTADVSFTLAMAALPEETPAE